MMNCIVPHAFDCFWYAHNLRNPLWTWERLNHLVFVGMSKWVGPVGLVRLTRIF